jgi:hypothetical protein
VLTPSLPCVQRCGSASLVIPVGLALPYFWRFVQCVRVFLDTGARPQIWNAIKYSTAFPVGLACTAHIGRVGCPCPGRLSELSVNCL